MKHNKNKKIKKTKEIEEPVEPVDTAGNDEHEDPVGNDEPEEPAVNDEPEETVSNDEPDEPEETAGNDEPDEPEETVETVGTDEPEENVSNDEPKEPEEPVGNEEPDVIAETTDCEESKCKLTKTSGENVEIQSKQKKQRKQKEKIVVSKFSSSCEHCSKLFKNSKLYNKHTQEQLCYKDNEITYCKICLITYKNHNEYKTHLFSLEHINKIGCESIEKINDDNKSNHTNTIHKLDPYLNENDVKKISSHNLGDSFTFVYEKGNTQTITLKSVKTIIPIKPIKPISKNLVSEVSDISDVSVLHTALPNTTPNTMIGGTNINTDTDLSSVPEPTIRQTKIINFLEKQILQSSLDDSGNNFYKMLDNKLQLEDYKGLQKIVKNLKINEHYKLNYLKTIDNFINYLVKEKTIGHHFFKDKDISQLVINLTS